MADNINSLYEKATDYYYNNDYDNAVKIYLEIINSDPKHHQSYDKLSKIERARNNLQKSAEYLENSLKQQERNATGWNELGNIYFDLRDFDNAIRCYKKSIDDDENFYWAYYNIGLSLSETSNDSNNNKDESYKWFNDALKIKSDYYPALNEIGLYFLNKQEYDKAESYFRQAISANSGYKYPYYNLAKVYKEKGDIEEAKKYMVRSIKCDSNYTSAYNYLGILFYDEEDYTTAMYYYTRAIEIDNKYKFSLYNIGLVFNRREQYKKAYQMYQRALESDPNYKPAIDEKSRLEEEYPKEIKDYSGLSDDDLKSSTYKEKSKLVNENVNFKNDITSGNNNTNDKNNENIENISNTGLTNKTTDNEQNNTNEVKEDFFAEKFGRNVTKMAKEGKLFDVKGRDTEIRSILEVLYKIKKNNPILVGKAGVGKTAIVEGLAQKIVKGEVPEFFKKMEIVEINMGMLIAGTTYRGDFEKRLKRIIDETVEKDNIILFIDEIHTVLGAGETSDSSLDAANILKPALARGELRCIGATTIDEYHKYFQKDPAFERRFYKVMIDELDTQSTLEILKDLKPKMQSHYKIDITDEKLNLIVDLSAEEIKNRVFPDKAIDILEKSFSRCALDCKKEVDELTIKNIVGELVGIKFLDTEEDKGRHLLEMEKFLKERIYGQDHVIDQISSIIRLTKQKLDLKPEQPDGVFFFAGPTGVGKTYLAKQIAQFLFGNEDKLYVLNMSEFSEPHSVSKLIGAPPGYIGHDEPSYFTKTILENPSSVLVLDEVEKAHPEVMKIFLQIFDEGKITDAKGRSVYFSNVTIIMTSNAIGVKQSSIGFDNNNTQKSDMELTKIFPIELVNRIDEVIIFNYIERDVARDILQNLIIKKSIKIFEKRGIEIKFDSTFIDRILEVGFNKNFGVRNLERAFEKELMGAVSRFLFERPDVKVVNVSADNGNVTVF